MILKEKLVWKTCLFMTKKRRKMLSIFYRKKTVAAR